MLVSIWTFGQYIYPGGVGGSLIFPYIRRLKVIFGVQNFEFQYFLGFSEKRIFLGYEDFVVIFWVITKLDYI